MRARHEPMLEVEAAVRRVEPGAQAVVGRGQHRGLEAERSGNPHRDSRKRVAAAQSLGADELQAEVAVAEPEPRFAADGVDRLERMPAFVRPAPPALLIGEPRECVDDAVEIRRHRQSQHVEVVADVHDHRDSCGIDRSDDAAQEARAANASAEHGDLHSR